MRCLWPLAERRAGSPHADLADRCLRLTGPGYDAEGRLPAPLLEGVRLQPVCAAVSAGDPPITPDYGNCLNRHYRRRSEQIRSSVHASGAISHMSARDSASIGWRSRDGAAGCSSHSVEPVTTGCKANLAAVVGPLQSFLRRSDGAGTITSLLTVFVLLLALAGVVDIVRSAYASDKYRRAAWSAAYHLALSPNIWGNEHLELALACDVIKRELQVNAAFECGSTWTVDVHTGVSPMNLLNGTNPDAQETHASMVVVEIGWNALPWSWLSTDSEEVQDRSRVARGVARGEPLD